MKIKYSIVLLLIFIVFLFGCSFDSSLSTNAKNKTQIFVSKKEHVSLRYSKEWQPIKNTPHNSYATVGRYEGKDGFFEISCYAGDSLTFDEVVEKTVNTELRPYGNNPKIISLKIDKQDARLIIPVSETQELNSQAALIVKYPENIKISLRGNLYNYFILFADINHIQEISNTIKFIP